MDVLGNTYSQTARAFSDYAWRREAVPLSKGVMAGSSKVAIIGAGPYGLSIAAHLRAHGIDFRIFGIPMYSWRTRMPAGMFLKSEGFASSLHEPAGRFTLERFCAEGGLRYAAKNVPVPLETFTEYGLAFQRQLVPNVEEKVVVGLNQSPDGFLLRLDDGETVAANRVVVAVGITYFPHVPAGLAHLPSDTFSHTSDHHDLGQFKGADVTVIGGGASALDVGASLHEIGAEVRLVARQSALKFNVPPTRPWWKRWQPTSGLGDGWRHQFYEHGPMLFRRLPQGLRRWIVDSALGPAGGFPVKDRVERMQLLLGHSLLYAQFHDGRVHLRLLCPNGEERTLSTDHVIAGTGYRVDLRKLTFLSKELHCQLRTADFAPILSAEFQSSVPGLYFAGLAASNTFGPAMRFLLGARYTARRLAKHFSKSA
jgi:Pyridine nucleotide-disulphide oxidoreductase